MRVPSGGGGLDVDHLGAEHRQDMRAGGPAQNAVRSSTRRPANGNAPGGAASGAAEPTPGLPELRVVLAESRRRRGRRRSRGCIRYGGPAG